jgi:hypothetical protein
VQDLRCRRPFAVQEKAHLVGRHFSHAQPLEHYHRRGKQIQNASLRACKDVALAGVGLENGVGCVGLALPGVSSGALSWPNPRQLLESPVFVHHVYCTTKVGETSIGKRLNSVLKRMIQV